MGTLRRIWGSWSTRRRVLTVGAIVLAFAGVAVAGYLLVLKRPGDISDPDAEFVEGHGEDSEALGAEDRRLAHVPAQPGANGLPAGQVPGPPFGTSKWSLPIGHLIEHAPIIVGDRMYILDLKGILYAVDKRNGKIIYKKDMGELSAAAPGYHDGKVYVINLDPDQIVALRAKDGKELWRKPIGSPGSESSRRGERPPHLRLPVRSVYALNPKTGETLWETETAGEIKSAVAYHEGTIFGSNYGGEFFAIDASDGGVKWTTPIIGGAFGRGGGSYSTPAIAYGRVYVGALDSRVYSLDIDSGEIAWTFSTGAEVYPGPVVADVKGAPPSVYIASADAQAYALDAKSGGLRWKRSVGDQVIGSGVVIGSTFYVSRASDQGMVGFEAASGKQVFDSDLGALLSCHLRRRALLPRRLRHCPCLRVEAPRGEEGQGEREIKKAKKKAKKQAEVSRRRRRKPRASQPEG